MNALRLDRINQNAVDRRKLSRTSVEETYVNGAIVMVEAKQLDQSLSFAKRAFDIILSAGAILTLSPLFLLVALLVKITSKGPVFFVQKRVGLGGRFFNMYKVRTMVVNAEALKETLSSSNEQSGPVFKIKNDPRITKIGAILRKHSIDELPQLFNVLKGRR